MVESIKINELRAALKKLLESGEFAGTSSHAIMARMPSMQGDKNLRALATLKARALLSQPSPDVQFTDGIKAIDIAWDEQHNDVSRSHTPFGVFWVRSSTYREGYSAFFGSELLDMNQSTANPMTKDQAKFLCQVAFQAMVFQLIERK